MKQTDWQPVASIWGISEVSDHIWETFDGLFKTVHRQGRTLQELEARIADLERRLNDAAVKQPQAMQPLSAVNEMPAERAA